MEVYRGQGKLEAHTEPFEPHYKGLYMAYLGCA